ncbi:hypothetical protein Bca52824_086603 [Brassica carinata]|uniref:Uncharacterized protein n=1 Tax=Brassica carinata TaxID=52824 RepID=A0A8X7TM12_BRACI|nr:hypothetical protein Bca52824_086603 [Brassica carinata]
MFLLFSSFLTKQTLFKPILQRLRQQRNLSMSLQMPLPSYSVFLHGAANPSKPAGNVKSVIENSALLIFKNPEKFVENYFGQNIGSVVYCNGFVVIYNTSPTLSQSITSPSFTVTFQSSTYKSAMNRITSTKSNIPSPSSTISVHGNLAHLLVKFWVARIVKKGSERGVDMLLWQEAGKVLINYYCKSPKASSLEFTKYIKREDMISMMFKHMCRCVFLVNDMRLCTRTQLIVKFFYAGTKFQPKRPTEESKTLKEGNDYPSDDMLGIGDVETSPSPVVNRNVSVNTKDCTADGMVVGETTETNAPSDPC